ncbi:MAG: DEAD/DEAH box helicase [bacterium]|nr:DEAD/DEAH box helicase [bacterium]
MNANSSQAQQGFYGLGIAPGILESLTQLKFTAPTPIQEKTIPLAIEGKDVVGIAQTGTGKTLAFGIPMIQRLLQGKEQGIVVLPTRELALQVEESLRKIGAKRGLRTVVLIGGTSIVPQKRALSSRPHIVVGTPGRINDHIQQRTLSLKNFPVVVLDEADRMFDMGFLPQIRAILRELPSERQTMLFSATMPPEIMKLAAEYMKIPVRVEIAPPGTTVEGVSQELFVVPRDQKTTLLAKLLETYKGPTLVFTRTKFGAKKVAKQIRDMGIRAAEIHSNRTLGQRREALEGFKSGRYRVLVATDIASRGIDVTGIELVLNYDLPSTPEDYIHRIGRTARAGAKGHAITFAMVSERREIRMIERAIQKTLPPSSLPEGISFSVEPRSPQPSFSPERGGYRGGGNRRYGSRSPRSFGARGR